MKKQAAILVTIVLLVFPFKSALAVADTTLPAAGTTITSPGTTSPGTTPPVTSTKTAPPASQTSMLPPVLDVNGQPVSPGTLPDSHFYWLANILQKLQLIFTFDTAKKAALDEQQALQKLAAAQEMMKKGKPEAAQKAVAEYADKITEAQAFLAQLQDSNSPTAQKLQSAFAKTNVENIQILSGLLDKLPQQAAQTLAVNIVRSIEKTVDKMNNEEKTKIGTEIKKTTQNFDPAKLNEEAKTAFASFQTSLGLKESSEIQNEDNTILLSEDPNQPNRTIGEEKRAAAAKEQEKKAKAENGHDVQGPGKEHDGEHQGEQDQKQEDTKVQQPVTSQTNLTNPSTTSEDKKAAKDGEDKSKGRSPDENNSEKDD